MNSLAPKSGYNSLKWRILVVLIPLVIVAVDYLRFPIVFDAVERTADLTFLLSQQTQSIGTFLGHPVFASIDDIQDSNFLSQLNQRGNALVTSAFTSEDDQVPFSSGALLSAVRQKLQRISSNDYRRLVESLDRKGARPAGDVLPVPLSLPADKYREFPIDTLFVLFFDEGADIEARDLAKGINTVLTLAQTQGISALIIPCAGTQWESKHSLKFALFFDTVFSALSSNDRPFAIYLSLYDRWPSFVLEDAVASLNGSWHASFQQREKISIIYRFDCRVPFLFLSVCLLVCSFFTPLTLKNILTISFYYYFTSKGLGSSETTGLVFKLGVLTVLALFFPYIVNWSVKDIFTTDAGKQNGGR